ncbi:MAG: trypsin-like peptidase domain-containing protein [Candidatus Dojkabacteria bacterium]|nr:trypsin-like peptidase domain-containing protein [Candidatus Dojkabacteria bacterium]
METEKKDAKKEVKKEKKKLNIKFIKIKDPKKAGIVAFVSLLVFASLMLGSIVTITVLNGNLINSDTEETTSIENGEDLTVVVTKEESSIIDVVDDATKSVVSIAVTQMSFSQEEGVVDESSNIGTGFIVDSSGIIVTNQHVVSDTDEDYKVITSDGQEYEVLDIQRDDNNDIAVLKIDATGLTPLTLGNSDAIVVGQTVIAIGTPLGEYVGSVTSGIISGLDRDVTASTDWFGTSSKTYENVIQTDAAVNPGNSGGPLLNTSGEVIGINFATTSGADNISFALPINIVKTRIDEYITYGKFIKPYLGVSYQMISEYQAMYYNNVVAGALIVRVDPYGPAYDAGIERGDIIIEFDGEAVESSLSTLISNHKVGDEIELKVWNDGDERSVTVILVEEE